MNWRTLPETKALGGGGFRRPSAFNVRVRVRDQCALPRRLDDLQSRSNRLLKFVFEGGGCATLIQDRALRRMKDSARPGPGFENFASFASIGVFQQPANSP